MKNRKLEIDLKEYLTDFPECYKMLRNMSGLICSFTLCFTAFTAKVN